jgi:hypothetical protein
MGVDHVRPFLPAQTKQPAISAEVCQLGDVFYPEINRRRARRPDALDQWQKPVGRAQVRIRQGNPNVAARKQIAAQTLYMAENSILSRFYDLQNTQLRRLIHCRVITILPQQGCRQHDSATLRN